MDSNHDRLLRRQRKARHSSAFPSDTKGLSAWGILGEDKKRAVVDTDLGAVSTFVSCDRLPCRQLLIGVVLVQCHSHLQP